ncbi:hypothetical protein HMPREF9087_0760 [Enterococcus casseliflavus ATCC 12755]|uniref:Uncharacterized protein n=1 Tax=Enterococcus casseliflavus ATCC 12755 TaxID=888066 RepID=F0EH77_ENTCA|nr:hypothetical protein HMPREF9087_0760 [Enterococcus casseliflavus ATCC 12755]EPH59516.1 hypothetical protein D931_03738 [Enterococcus faecium 13.SD.W.09]EPH86985.1 hypothetical protein D922_04419 [Enterococcus faecalis 06-MB-DW-09]
MLYTSKNKQSRNRKKDPFKKRTAKKQFLFSNLIFRLKSS